jgi:hypothetical protein
VPSSWLKPPAACWSRARSCLTPSRPSSDAVLLQKHRGEGLSDATFEIVRAAESEFFGV